MAGSKFPVFPAFLIAVAGFVLSGCGGGGSGGGSSGFGSISALPIGSFSNSLRAGLSLEAGKKPWINDVIEDARQANRADGGGGATGTQDDNEGQGHSEAEGQLILGEANTDPRDSTLTVTDTGTKRIPSQETTDIVVEIEVRQGDDGQQARQVRFTEYYTPEGDNSNVSLIGTDDFSNLGVMIGLEHQAFGVWIEDFRGDRIPGAASFAGPGADRNAITEASATYEGGALGILRDGEERHLTAAELNANVNFNTNKYEITTSGTHRVELREGAEAILDSDLDFRAIGDVRGASLEIGEADGKTSDYFGEIQGKLLGEGAEEIGGIFRLDNDQGAIYTGSFGAIRETTP